MCLGNFPLKCPKPTEIPERDPHNPSGKDRLYRNVVGDEIKQYAQTDQRIADIGNSKSKALESRIENRVARKGCVCEH